MPSSTHLAGTPSGWRPAPIEANPLMLHVGRQAAGADLSDDDLKRIWGAMMGTVPEIYPKVLDSQASPMQVYDLRSGHEWGTFCLRSWQRSEEQLSGKRMAYGGELLIHSSFGNWAYSWHACGEPFKDFLASCDRDYLLGKLLGDRLKVFDGNLTVQELRRMLLGMRRTGGITRDGARTAWDAIKQHERRLGDSADEFVNGCQDILDELEARQRMAQPPGCIDDSWRDVFTEPWEMLYRSIDPSAQRFWDRLWTEFLAALRREKEGVSP